MKYIALLRAINVGGHNKIKMEELKNLFVSLGYKNVETVIQSGNVIFETSGKNLKLIRSNIEKKLYGFMKKEIKVFLRTCSELSQIAGQNPFGDIKEDDYIKTYVFFLYGEPENKVSIPFLSPSKEVNVFKKTGLHLFMSVKKIPGKASSPNDLIEKTFGVPATARNWNVVGRIIEKATAKTL